MNNWAVIRTGGKQYKVAEGDIISIEKLSHSGQSIDFKEVMLLAKDDEVKIGRPLVEKAKVKAKVLKDFKDKKVRVVKFKSKSRYLKTTGHRQQKTKILIEKIEN